MADTEKAKNSAKESANETRGSSSHSDSGSAEDKSREAKSSSGSSQDKYGDESSANDSAKSDKADAGKGSGDGEPSSGSGGSNQVPKQQDDGPQYGAPMEKGYIDQDDIDNDDGDSSGKDKKGGESNPLKKKAKDAALHMSLMAAVKAAQLAAKAALLMFLKMMLQMLAAIAQQVAAAVVSFVAAVMNVLTSIAAFLSVSVTVAAFGAVGVLALAVVATVAFIAGYVDNDGRKDAGSPCDEPYEFVYSTTPTADTLAAAQKVYAFFHELGYTDTNIAGILGNWEVESGIDATSVELVYDQPFSDMSAKTEANFKKFKNWAEAHEACKCKWLTTMIDRGYMEAVEWADDACTKPTKYEYTLSDPDYHNDGTIYYVDRRPFDYCYNCEEGYEVECSHGYTEEHTVYSPSGSYGCTDGYKVECEHGFSETHHVPAYHAIDFRMRCMDWQFTPPGVMSDGCETGLDEHGNVRWVLPGDTSIPEYDHENDVSSAGPGSLNFEGFRLYDTHTDYDNVYVGLGLGQWTNGRNRMLMDFATRHAVNWFDIETQLAFMIAADGDAAVYRNFLAGWQEEPNPQQAAWVFTKKWEGNTTRGIEERKTRAASWYVTISEWNRTGAFDAAYGQSVIAMAGATANSATNVAAAESWESCEENFNADNSTVAAAALSYAWPDKSMSHNNGTARWRFVKDSVIGVTDGQGRSWQYKSCDRTVATAVRWAGADSNYPAGPVTSLMSYMSSSDKWAKIPWDGNKETLQPGDVMIKVTAATAGGTGNHVMLFVGHEAVQARAAQPECSPIAAWAQTAANPLMMVVDGSFAGSFDSESGRSPSVKVFSSSYMNPQSYDIFRCIQKDVAPVYAGLDASAHSGVHE